jgi:protein-S-isoprenylcysteine O-methyltransferase Ste14
MKFRASPPVRIAAAAVFLAGLIFLAAGRLDYWQGWVFLSLNVVFLAATGWALRNAPDLVAERLHPGRGTAWWDKVYFIISTPLYFGAVVVGAMDGGRRLWSAPPDEALYAAAAALFILGQSLFLWAKKSNPFFSSVVRLQADRGQTVCREGPYRICRHPGYLGGLLFGLTTPILLGSYWALIPQTLAALLLVVRTVLEDRMLTRDLLWYAEYKRSVPARLVPRVW